MPLRVMNEPGMADERSAASGPMFRHSIELFDHEFPMVAVAAACVR